MAERFFERSNAMDIRCYDRSYLYTNAGRPKNYIELDLYPALRGLTQIKEEVFVFQCTTQCIFFCTYLSKTINTEGS